jgi:hypothetical protein
MKEKRVASYAKAKEMKSFAFNLNVHDKEIEGRKWETILRENVMWPLDGRPHLDM